MAFGEIGVTLRVSLLSMLIPVFGLSAQGTSACRPADAASSGLVADVSTIVTSSDARNTRLRLDMRLPQVSSTQVTYVTDKNVCNKVLPVYNATTRSFNATTGAEVSTPSGKLYIVKVGTVYVAWDPGAMAGEYRRLITLDKTYKVVANSLL